MHVCNEKVSIVGAGFVGATAAYAMMIQKVANEIALIDVNREKAEGEAMDLKHGLRFAGGAKVSFGNDYSLCEDSDVVVITAGSHQKPGETRLDLVRNNARIFKQIIPQIARCSPESVMLIVTNPVDVMTFLAQKFSSFQRSRVFGSGTALDTARFRCLLGEQLNVSTSSVHAYILGEHGDSEFPVWSSATIGGIKVSEFPGFKREKAQFAFEHTKNAAYEIISRKGATYYAIGLTISGIVDAVLSDKNEVLPLSTNISSYYGLSNVCLSIPCVVGKGGVKERLFPKLDGAEQSALKKSAAVIKHAIHSVI